MADDQSDPDTIGGKFPSEIGGDGGGGIRANPTVVESIGDSTSNYVAGSILDTFAGGSATGDVRPGIFYMTAYSWGQATPLFNYGAYSTIQNFTATQSFSPNTLLGGEWQLAITASGATTSGTLGFKIKGNLSTQGYFSNYAASNYAAGYDHLYFGSLAIGTGTPASTTLTFNIGNFNIKYGSTSLSTYNIIGILNRSVSAMFSVTTQYNTPPSVTNFSASLYPQLWRVFANTPVVDY